MMLRRLFFGYCLMFSTLSVYSQEPEKIDNYNDLMNLSIEELLDLNINVNVASNDGEKLFNSPSTVTIITRKTIQDYNFQTISEALQSIAGIMVVNCFLKKDIPTARGILQDNYANKILYLINGIPTFNAITGEGILNRIDINDVERIEVLKGPASVLYGSNAYSGAINIVMKSVNTNGIESHAGFGNNILATGAQASYSKNYFKFFISGNSFYKTNENTSFIDENGESGKYENLAINQNFTVIGSIKDFSFFMNTYKNQEGFLGVLSSYKSGASNPQRLMGYLTNIGFDHSFTEKLKVNARLESDINQRILSRDRNDSIRSNILAYRYAFSFSGNYKILNWLNLNFGGQADYRQSASYSNYIKETQTIITDNNLKNRDVIENSFFVQSEFTTGKLKSIAGMRFTHNTLFGPNFSPRLSMVYNFNEKNSLKAIYGESYRAPSLFELYFINPDSSIFGNKTLKPEKMRSFEIAYLKTINYFFFQLQGYYGTHMNKIQRIAIEYGPNTENTNKNIYSNVHDFNAYGFEAEIKYSNPKIFQSFFNYAYATGSKGDTIGTGNHYNFKYVPEHQISAGIQKDFYKNWFTSAIYRFWSQTNGPIEKIEPQQTVDINLGLRHEYHSFQFVHSLSIKNIFNSQLQFPDYVRRNINSIPWGDKFAVTYSLKLMLL